MVTYLLTIFKVKPSRQTVGLSVLIPVTKRKQLMPGNRTSYTYLNIITIIISYISTYQRIISSFHYYSNHFFYITETKGPKYQFIRSASIKMNLQAWGPEFSQFFVKYVGGWGQLIRLSFCHVRSPQCSNAYWSNLVTGRCYVRGVWTDWIFPPKSCVIHPDV